MNLKDLSEYRTISVYQDMLGEGPKMEGRVVGLCWAQLKPKGPKGDKGLKVIMFIVTKSDFDNVQVMAIMKF